MKPKPMILLVAFTLVFTALVVQARALAQGIISTVVGNGSSGDISWRITGNLNVARRFHTATLLRDGKVLVIGGNGSEHSAELYDPALGTWTISTSSNLAHGNHTATLLSDGRVLVVNSEGGAELFDPVTGLWSVTGHLNDANRYYHTATLLFNGSVLVAGGANDGLLFNATNSAELYDPAAGTWTRTGNLNTLCAMHTATLLRNGTVLIVGGSEHDDGVDSDAEVYEPATGIWTVTGNLSTPRAFHTATPLINGKVMVTAGITYKDRGFAPTDSAELYDPSTGNWSTTGILNLARQFHTATLLPDGKVVVAGGASGHTSPSSLNAAETYDPTTGTWSLISNLISGRYWHTATLLSNGKVLVAGGFNTNGSSFTTLTSAELYGSGNNSIDDARFFVRQHYLDFLNREPEQSGLDAWLGILNRCPDIHNDPTCDRIIVSASFFNSPEFHLKGYFVFRFYRLALNRLPTYDEIASDMQGVSGQTADAVYARKVTFANSFTSRPEFVTSFGTLSNAEYVAALMNRYQLTSIVTPEPFSPDGTTRVTLTSVDLIAQLDGNGMTRAQVLRAIADSDQIFQLEYNRAFVAMQYYGYLRRTPEIAGYNAWLTYLDANPTDFRTMVRGFMDSIEYRRRFGS